MNNKGLISFAIIGVFFATMVMFYMVGTAVGKNIESFLPAVESYIPTDIFFTNLSNFEIGKEPYEEPVRRYFSSKMNIKQAVISELIKGPNAEELANGLFVSRNGVTSALVDFDIKNYTANVYLAGKCNSNGASYTIGNLIDRNLKQFGDVKYVRIHDEEGKTSLNLNLLSDSSPSCLEP